MPVLSNLFRAIIHPLSALAVFLLSLLVLGMAEQQIAHMPFVAFCLAAIAGAAFAMSGRLSSSIFIACYVGLLACMVSLIKYRLKGSDLHGYDLIFSGSDPEAIRFLASEYAYFVFPVLLAAAGGLATVAFCFRAEPGGSQGPVRRLAPLLVSAAGLIISYPLQPEHPRYFHYLAGFNASSFFVSLLDLPLLLDDIDLVERLAALPPQGAFDDSTACKPEDGSPDVIMVLSESQTDPVHFPQIKVGKPFSESFRSGDGKKHELVVETFGGGTWIANLSMLTGLSSTDFAPQSPYLTTFWKTKSVGRFLS
jgi:hypothetical protein